MLVEINEDWRDFVQAKIDAGGFESAAQVVAVALSRWAVDELQFAPGELDALIKPAIEQLDRGEVLTAEQVDRRMDEHRKQFLARRQET